jgi:hypothetical protein
MYSSYDKNILLLYEFCNKFIENFQGIENIRFVFDPEKYFNSEKNLYLSHFMVQYKCQVDLMQLISTSVYQWSHLNIFGIGPHRLCDKTNKNTSYDEIRDYIRLSIPQAFERNFFTSYIELDYLDIKNLAAKIKDYSSLSESLEINEGEDKRITKV